MPRIDAARVAPAMPRPTRAPSAAELNKVISKAEKNGTLTQLSSADAKKLEAKLNKAGNDGVNLAQGLVGSSRMGFVVDGNVFLRTKVVRPGVEPKFFNAGPLAGGSKPDIHPLKPGNKPSDGPNIHPPKPGTRPEPGWTPGGGGGGVTKAKVLSAMDQLMRLGPPKKLTKAETAEFLKELKSDPTAKSFPATPKGLAGASWTAHVVKDWVFLETKPVRPGATSTFAALGPMLD